MESLQAYGSDCSETDDESTNDNVTEKKRKEFRTPQADPETTGKSVYFEQRGTVAHINQSQNFEPHDQRNESFSTNVWPDVYVMHESSRSSESRNYESKTQDAAVNSREANAGASIRSTNIFPSCFTKTSNPSRNMTVSGINLAKAKVCGYVSKRKRQEIEQNQSKMFCSAQNERQEPQNSNKSNTYLGQTHLNVTENREVITKEVINRAPKKLYVNLQRHTKGVNCVRWNLVSKNLLLSASMDQTVCVWDALAKGDCSLQLTCHSGAVKDAQWSNCGSCVLSCGYDKMVRLSDINTGAEKQRFPHTDYVTCICCHPNDPNIFLSGTFKSGIASWDTRSNKIISKYQDFFGQVQDLVFLPGGEEFISASEVIRRNATDKGLMAWDFKSTAVLSNQIYQEAFTCTCLRVHPRSDHFLAQSSGNYVAIFSTKKPYKLNKYKRFEGHQVSGYKIGCDISPDGSLIVSGSTDGSLYIYNHMTSRVLRTITAYDGVCMDVAFHPELPSTIATCSWDGDVSVWQ